jgi:hypothetical protein
MICAAALWLKLLVVGSPPLRSGSIVGQIVWFSGGQNSTWVGFLRVLRFPLTILIPPTAPYSFIILPLTLYNLDTESVVK